MVVNDRSNPDGQPPPQKSQKQMTKAERRELQERQRAAKAEKTVGNNAQKSTPRPAGQKPPALDKTTIQKSRRLSVAVPPTPGKGKDKDPLAAQADDLAGRARGLRIFSHFDHTKPSSSKGDIHPAIARLALQFSEFKISGANARCIATLTAFKTVRYRSVISSTSSLYLRDGFKVIQDYVTPPDSTLSRHLLTYISPQINHLRAARPMSVTMGNAIRQLKLEISGSDIDLPEQDVRSPIRNFQRSSH